ncbi:MAG: hypothetical protein HKL90_04640 [Elusimicrobia bacterium]|nr:hypothetical protein [Elusimicrobiota bacterium]
MTFALAPLVWLAAAARADGSLLKNRPTQAVVGQTVEVSPLDGDHFNKDAPQKCGGDAPLELRPHLLRCRFRRPGVNHVLVTICDDALTFCRQERFDVDVRPGAATTAAAPASLPAAAPRGGAAAPPGFIDNDPKAAFARARARHALVLVDFYGIWCPPCNDLAEYAYPDPAFKAASRGWVKLALDADAQTSFALKDRWKVGGYPTLIAADAEGREIGRVVGFLSGPALAKFLDQSRAQENEPVEKAAALLARGGPDATPERRLRVARWRAARGEFAAAEDLLAHDDSAPARRALLEMRRERAGRENDNAAAQRALTGLIQAFPADAEYADWVQSLSEIDTTTVRALLTPLRACVARWSVDPTLGEQGEDPGDLFYDEASVLAALGDKSAARDEFSKAADAYAAQAARSPLKTPRAANLGRADALMKAGRRAEAKALYESLVKAYPAEFTFNYEYATALSDDGDFTAAYPYAVAAASDGYGDNRLRAVRLKAELEIKLGRAAEAAKTVARALAETPEPKTKNVRTFRYLAALRKLQARLASAKGS